MNSANKNVSKHELLSLLELSNFKNYIQCKYSPNVIQNDCLVKFTDDSKENKLFIEFIFNLKYGTDYVDFICEPILVYQKPQSYASANISELICANFSPIFHSDDLIELIFNEKTIELSSFSTLLAKLKINNKKITNMGLKYFIPLEIGILNSGFVINSDNQGELKVKISIKKTPFRQVNLMDYHGFQIKYKSYIVSKYKIKNSNPTIKLLNQYFSHPSNKKLLSSDLKSIQKICFELYNPSETTNQTQSFAQSQSQTDPIYKSSIFSSYNKIQRLESRKEPQIYSQELYSMGMPNYSNIVGTLYNDMSKSYDYDNVQSFNSGGFGDVLGNMFQSSIDNEFNDEIEEYKKIDIDDEKQHYYQKEKIFNKKTSLLCDVIKEINPIVVYDKSVSFQMTPLSNLYFYFSNHLIMDNKINLFDSIRLKLNGKTIYETEREILEFNVDSGNSNGLYLIPIGSSGLSCSKSNSLDNYELVFDGLTQQLNTIDIKLFESSKYLSYYSDSEPSPCLIKL